MSDDIVERARRFATKAHEGQTRKYTGEAYIRHPEAVVGILRGAGIDDPETLAAAWLHDALEDCPVDQFEIADEFGDRIRDMVFALTDCGRGLGNRAARKALDRSRLAKAPAEVQSIKAADMIDNTTSIVERDPEFAKTYMREKAALLPMLTRADAGLIARAARMLEEYETRQVSDWLEARPHA